MISVIVAIYNVKETLLRNCLDSLVNQTNKNFELILVDDGSTDNSGKIADSYSKYDFVKVVHKKNGGLSDCRNKGISVATGEWLTFVDGDDCVELNMIDILYKNIGNTTPDVYIYPCYVEIGEKQIFNPFLPYERKKYVDNKNIQLQSLAKGFTDFYPEYEIISVAWGKLYNRKLFFDKNIRFLKKLRAIEDVIFNLYIFEESKRIDYINIPIYHYVINKDSITNKYSETIVDDYNKQFIEIKKFLDLYNKDKIYYEALDSFKVRAINFYMSNYFFNKQNKKSYREKKEEILNLLNSSIYKDALDNIDFKRLGIYQKMFVYCLKKEYIYLIKILIFIKLKIKSIMFK